MKYLYLIGGVPRSGKTTILQAVIAKRPMLALSADALRSGLRNALFGEPYVSVKKLFFKGKVDFTRPGTGKKFSKKFAQTIGEEALTWNALVGVIDAHDRHSTELIAEGMVITPERVHKLRLKNLRLRVLFCGYENETHADTIFAHAARSKHDWINTWLKETKGDEKEIRKFITGQVQKSQSYKQAAKKYGYRFLDITKDSFSSHVRQAQSFLLKG